MSKLNKNSKNSLISIKDAASMLGVSTKTLRRWEDSGKLVPERTNGGHRRYLVSKVTKFKASKSKKVVSIPSKTFFASVPQASVSPVLPTVSYPEVKATPVEVTPKYNSENIYRALHIDQKKIFTRAIGFAVIAVAAFGIVKLAQATNIRKIAENIELAKPYLSFTENYAVNKDELKPSQVLASRDSLLSSRLDISIVTNFADDVNIAQDLSVAGAVNIEGLTTATDIEANNLTLAEDLSVGGVAVITGNTTVGSLTINDETFTDLTGAGLQITDGVLETILGTSITSTEITDGSITEADLSITNSPTDNQVLTYDSATGTFSWANDSTGETSPMTLTSGVVHPDATTDDLAVGGTTSAAPFFVDAVTGEVFINSIGLNDVGSDNITSGASLIGVYDEFSNSSSTTLQDVLDDFDSAIGGGASKFTQDTGFAYLTSTTDQLVIGGSSSLSSKLAVDGDADEIQLLIQGNATQTNNLVVFENSAGTDLFTLNNSGNLTLAGSLTVGGEAVSDFSGNGIVVSGGALTVDLTVATDGLSSTTSTGSGLEVLASGLTLIQGCANGEVLKWNETNDSWECSTDSGAAFAIVNIENNDVAVGASVDTVDFSTDFSVTASPANEANVSIADDIINFTEIAESLTLDANTDIALGALTLSTSGTGAVDFNSTGQVSFAGNVDAENGLDVTGASLTIGGSYSITTGGVITAATDETINGVDINAGAVSDVTTLTLTTASNSWGASGLTANVSADITLTAGDDFVFDDLQLTSAITLTDTDTAFTSGDTAIVDAINTAYNAAVGGGGGTWTLDTGTIYPANIAYRVGIGTTDDTAIISKLYITSDATALTGKSLAILNQTESQDIFTASASGVTRFTIANSGNLIFEGTGADDANETTLTLTNPTADRTITLPDADGEVSLLGQTIANNELVNSSITFAGDAGSGAISLGGTFTIAGGEGIDTSFSGSTITVTGEDATGANKGIASFAASYFTVTAGDVAITADGLDFDQLDDALALDANTAVTTGAFALSVDSLSLNDTTLSSSGSLSITSAASGDIILTASDDFSFDDAQLTSAITLTDTAVDFDSGDTGIVDAINTAYNAATGGGGAGVWTLASNTLYPTTVGNKVGIGTTTAGTIISKLYVTGNSTLTGKSVAIFNQTEAEDVLTASSSGTPVFVIANNGDVNIRSTVANSDRLSLVPYNAGSNTFTGDLTTSDLTADRTWTLPDEDGTVCLSSGNCAGGAGGSKWTDDGSVTYLTGTTDELVLGGASALSSAKLSIDGDADQIQLIVQGNATQTSNLLTLEQSDGTDVFTVTNAGLVSANDLTLSLADGSTVNIDGDGTPTADILQIGSGDTSSTDGVDALQLTFGVSAASGSVIDITPSYADAVAGTTSETYNIIDIDAFTATQNASTDTGLVRGLNIGNLTQTETSGTITATALNLGTGWDSLLSYNGTTIIDGTGNVQAGQISGTLFSTNSDSASANAIARGDTLVINGDSNGIDVTHSADTFTVAFDGTEVGSETWGAGSGFTWTFDAGATDPTIAFASDAITFTSATNTFAGNVAVGNNTISGGTAAINFTNFDVASTGNITVAAGVGIDTNGAGALAIAATNATSVTVGSSAVTAFTVTTDGTGDAEVVLPTGSISGTEILNDTVVLTTDTDGNYVASVANGTGITGGAAGSEGATLTLAVDQTTNFAWTGQHSWTNTITATGAQTDFNLTLGADADVDNVSAVNIDVTSAATGDADVLTAVNIANLTSANATVVENAISVGTGWDSILTYNGTTIINGSGQVAAGQLTGTLFTVTDGSTPQTIEQGNTLTFVDDSDINFVTSATDQITANIINDSLDFDKFEDALDLDAATDIALGALTLSTSGTGALDFNSTGQVSFAGNLDAENGLDVTNASLTVGGNATITTAGLATFTDLAVNLADGATATINGDGSPTADVLSLSSGTSATDGVDNLQLTFGVSAASGNVIDITPSYADATAGTTSETYNIIDIDAFTATQNASTDTGLIRGLNIGNLTQTETSGTITATALNLGTGWDSLLSYNGTTVINGSGQLVSTQLTGTLFTITDGSTPQTIEQGNTLTFVDGTDNDFVTSATDQVTVNNTSTLATVTGRGATTTTAVSLNGGFNVDAAFSVADGGVLTTSQAANFDSTADFDGAADFSAGLTNSAGELLISGGNLQLNDSINLTVGTGDDLTIVHNGTNSLITSATGDLIVDNTLATGSTIFRLGTDTSATDFQIQNNSESALFTVDGSGAATFSGNLNANGGLDVDDVFVVADGGAVTANTDVDLVLASSENFTITSTTPTADAISAVLGTSTTDGVDGLQLSFGVSAASGNVIDITPSYTDATAGTTSETYNIIDIDAFTATQNASTDTGLIRGLNIGNLTQTETSGTITANALNIGTGWDDILTYNGTTIIDGDGTITGSVVDGFTAGSILFAGASGELTQDNTNFFFEDGTNELGLRTNTPDADLEIVSDSTNSDVFLLTATDGSRLGRFTETSGGAGWFEVDNASGTAVALFRADAGASYISTGTFAIGETAPDAKLEVLATTEQLRLTNVEDTSYASFTVDTNGDLTIAPNGADVNVTGALSTTTDITVGIADGNTANLDGDGSPTSDLLQIGNGDTSATDGADALQLSFGVSAASGNVIDITPSYADATAGTTSETYNIIDIDAFTATQNASTDTGLIRGLNIGNLTQTETSGTITANALKIGTGWDSILDYNGTTIIDGTGNVAAAQISGVLFTTNSDSASSNNLSRGDILVINGDSNGIDVTHSTDTFTVAFDGTEVGAETWGTGSGFAWTFDAGATDPVMTFASDSLAFSGVASTSFSGDVTTTGDILLNGGDLTTTSATFNFLDQAATKTIDIGAVTTDGATTVNIATEGTSADVIAVGNSNASTTVAITGGDDWNISAAGDFTGENIILSSAGTTSIDLTRSSAGQWMSFNDGTDTWGIYNTAGSPEGALAANTGALSMDTTNGTLYVKTDDTDNTGWVNLATGGTSPFESAGGVITKTTIADRLSLRYGEAADIQFELENTTNSTIPTVDAAVIDLNGNTTGIVTDGVDAMFISGEFGNGTTNTNSLLHLDLNPVNTPSGDEVFYAINIDGLTGTSATERAIGVASGWDTSIYLAGGTTGIGFAGTYTTGIDLSGASSTTDLILDDGLTIAQTADNDLTFTENSLSFNYDFGEVASTIQLETASSFDIESTANVADAITLVSTVGGIDITATGASAGEDIDITASSSINLSSSEAVNDAIVLSTSNAAGGIDITSSSTTVDALDFTADSLTTGIAMDISIDGLTTGKGINLQSTTTSTSFSGDLAYFEWAPGSATSATGDIFQINIGTNGSTTGKLFRITDTGSDLFAVGESVITSAIPHEFTAAGDVSVAYDIAFTNQTASFIKSNAPLQIESGETFESNNLTLKTYNSGDIVLDVPATGAAIVQGALSVDTQQTLTANSATPSVAGGSHFITANTGATNYTDFTGGTAGQLLFIEVNDANTTFNCIGSEATINCGNLDIAAAAGDLLSWIYDGTVWNLINWLDEGDTQTGADVAEYFPASEALEAGDLVAIDATTPVTVKKGVESDGQRNVGVISTQPGLTLGEEAEGSYKVALVGRVPVKVTQTSEAIQIGDLIGASEIAGHAKKVNGGYIVGRALEVWTPGSGDNDVMVFVNPIYVAESAQNVESLESRISTLESSFELMNASGSANLSDLTVTSINVLGDAILGDTVVNGKLNVGTIEISNIDNSVNAIGTLKIQNLALGNIEFLGGLITFDTDGNIVAKEITAEKYSVAGASAGKTTLPAGEIEIYIESDQVTEDSLIFVTAETQTPRSLSVTNKVAGQGFTVTVSRESINDIMFSWFIIDKVE